MIEKQVTEDKNVISSRRKFIKKIACGSFILLAGTQVAHARALYFAKRNAAHAGANKKDLILSKSHQKFKANLTRRLAATHHSHQTLALQHSTKKHDGAKQHYAAKKHYQQVKQYDVKFAENKPPIRSRLYRDESLITYDERRVMTHRIPAKMIALQNPHTGDNLRLTYFERGLYIEDALQEIDYMLRDFHTGDIHPIDPALLDQLYELKLRLGVSRPFNVISGYRSPATNASLRRHSDGVARNSLHMQGRAVDIRLDGYDAKIIRDAALVMQRGGVGYYPESNFVHLDTGSIRTWGA